MSEITAFIREVKYISKFREELETLDFKKFNINEAPGVFLLKDSKTIFSISKWVSPKRTRSYPYERVYNSLNGGKVITIIPIVKDEGFDGDRDFLQFDTVSLMSLLDVYIIYAYYVDAEKNNRYEGKYLNKITNQKFDNSFIKKKIKEIKNYRSSSLHWNLNELSNPITINNAIKSYLNISKNLQVKLHDVKGIEKFKNKLIGEVNIFKEFSRNKSKGAQNREFLTTQPKEILSTKTKSKITIKNYLGGLYHFTVDEIEISSNNLILIESKCSKSLKIPSRGDIRDGLLKMILYSNLEKVELNNKKYKAIPLLDLISLRLKGNISNYSDKADIDKFIRTNELMSYDIELIKTIFLEAQKNKFIIRVRKG
ncbi:MAG TPA: hypothetical protein VHP32_04100 [Ignavibacteria bacterium]|nr:hypothetical protein [Ignavibacteria bacterium]